MNFATNDDDDYNNYDDHDAASASNNNKNSRPTIPPELSKQILKAHLPEGDQKRITNETAKAVSELLRLFVLEAQSRALLEVRTTRHPGTNKGTNFATTISTR